MGVNYYGIKIPTVKEKEIIKEAIDNNDWALVFSMIPEKIHLGKSSVGWQFCFDHNYWEYFGKDLDQIKEFISGCSISNEYGEKISKKEFWDLVEAKKNSKAGSDRIVLGDLCFANYSDFS